MKRLLLFFLSFLTLLGTLHAETVSLDDTEEKGTDKNPYTVEEVKNYEGKEVVKVWVKGYIVGYISSTTLTSNNLRLTADNASESNIALGSNPDNASVDNVIGVQLSSTNNTKKEVRAALNLVNNPNNLGREVLVFGSLESYMGSGNKGIKETEDYEFKDVRTVVSLTFDPSEGTVKQGETYAMPSAIANVEEASSLIIYSIESDPNSIATLSEDKKNVTFDTEKTGSVTVRAYLDKNDQYTATPVTFTLTVKGDKEDPNLQFVDEEGNTVDEWTVYLEEDNLVFPTLSKPENVTVTYKFNPKGIVSIDENNEYTITTDEDVKVTITATSEAVEGYLPGEISYVLNIFMNTPDFRNEGVYKLVTNLDQIKNDTKCIIAFIPSVGDNSYVMSRQGSGKFRDVSTQFSISDDGILIEPKKEIEILNFIKNENGLYTIKANYLTQGFLSSMSNSSNNYLTTYESVEGNPNGEAEINIDEKGKAYIVFQGEGPKKTIFVNTKDLRFSCYGSADGVQIQPVSIYRYVTPIEVKWVAYGEVIDDEADEYGIHHYGVHRVANQVVLKVSDDESQISHENLHLTVEKVADSSKQAVSALAAEDENLYNISKDETKGVTVTLNKAGQYVLTPTVSEGVYEYIAENKPITVAINPLELEVEDLSYDMSWSNNGNVLESVQFTVSNSTSSDVNVSDDISFKLAPQFTNTEEQPDEMPETDGWYEGLWEDMIALKDDKPVDGYYYESVPEYDSDNKTLTVQFPCSGVYNIMAVSKDTDIIINGSEDSSTTGVSIGTSVIRPTVTNVYTSGETVTETGTKPIYGTFNVNGIIPSITTGNNNTLVSGTEIQYPYVDGVIFDKEILPNSLLYTPGLYMADLYWMLSETTSDASRIRRADSNSNPQSVSVEDLESKGYKHYVAFNTSTRPDLSGLEYGTTYNINVVVIKNGVSSLLQTNGEESELRYTITASQSYAIPTSVEAVGEDEGEVEYYTIDGIKVQNPTHGLYIVRKNGRTSKVIVGM